MTSTRCSVVTTRLKNSASVLERSWAAWWRITASTGVSGCPSRRCCLLRSWRSASEIPAGKGLLTGCQNRQPATSPPLSTPSTSSAVTPTFASSQPISRSAWWSSNSSRNSTSSISSLSPCPYGPGA